MAVKCSGEESTASVQKHALKGLATLGVDIKFDTRVVRATTVPTGQTEVTPNSSYIPSEFLSSKDFVTVDDYLKAKGAGDIWAVGDVVDIEWKQWIYIDRQSSYVAKNIILIPNNKAPVPYKATPDSSRLLGFSIGPNSAAGAFGSFKIPSLILPWGRKELYTHKIDTTVSGSWFDRFTVLAIGRPGKAFSAGGDWESHRAPRRALRLTPTATHTNVESEFATDPLYYQIAECGTALQIDISPIPPTRPGACPRSKGTGFDVGETASSSSEKSSDSDPPSSMTIGKSKRGQRSQRNRCAKLTLRASRAGTLKRFRAFLLQRLLFSPHLLPRMCARPGLGHISMCRKVRVEGAGCNEVGLGWPSARWISELLPRRRTREHRQVQSALLLVQPCLRKCAMRAESLSPAVERRRNGDRTSIGTSNTSMLHARPAGTPQ